MPLSALLGSWKGFRRHAACGMFSRIHPASLFTTELGLCSELFMQPFLCFFLQRLRSVGGYLSSAQQNRTFQALRLRDGGHYSRNRCTRRMRNVMCALCSMQFAKLRIFVYVPFVCLNIFGACILKRPLRVQLMANGCRSCCCWQRCWRCENVANIKSENSF